MKTEMTISNTAAIEVMKLIEEYLVQGGAGYEDDLLIEVLTALGEADRIVIEETKQ